MGITLRRVIIMPKLTFKFDTICDRCGNSLERETHEDGAALLIEPCPVCFTEQYDDGHRAGYMEGEADGYERGREDWE